MQQPVKSLALAQLCTEFTHRVVAFVGLAHLGRLLAHLQRDPLVFEFEVAFVDGEPFGGREGAQTKIDLDGLVRLHPKTFNEAVCVLSGGREPLVKSNALVPELLDRVLHPALQVTLHERFGGIDVDQLCQR